jgi:hypothetical protein
MDFLRSRQAQSKAESSGLLLKFRGGKKQFGELPRPLFHFSHLLFITLILFYIIGYGPAASSGATPDKYRLNLGVKGDIDAIHSKFKEISPVWRRY